MASQPANQTINVFRRVRTFREDLRHESVKNITSWLRGLVFSVPSEEVRTVNGDLDTSVSDLSVFAKDGFPITVGVRAAKDFSTVEALGALAGSPAGAQVRVIEIGHDKFVEHREQNLDRDLHQDLRDA